MPSRDFPRILEKEAPLFSGIASDDDHSRLLVTDFSSMWRACLRTKPTEKSRVRRQGKEAGSWGLDGTCDLAVLEWT